jgi:hypothetical protein
MKRVCVGYKLMLLVKISSGALYPAELAYIVLYQSVLLKTSRRSYLLSGKEIRRV